ncbi:hypothetical protein, conserved [Eimeria brunetti]|uniref:Uncharacterized protein n=1 Tax=Eimeria brunetti TaxID=51314 RepID=U6M2I6_9EIME|nr:hypothetical protein, conserved [Eimeria brunetti]
MKPAGVLGFLVVLSSSQCCLQGVAGSALPGASEPWTASTELQTNNPSLGEAAVNETDSPQQGTQHASQDAAENAGENGEEATTGATAAAAVEGAAPSAGQAAAGKKPGSAIAQPKNVAVGISLLLLLFVGLLASTRKKQVSGPPPYKEFEEPEKPPLTPEEERQQRLERMQLVSANAERIARAIGTPEASDLSAKVQQSLQAAIDADSTSSLTEHLDAANKRVSELHELAREYGGKLVSRHSNASTFPSAEVQEGGQDVSVMQLADKFDCNLVRCAAKLMRSLGDKWESATEFVVKLGEHLADVPAYTDENDRARFHQMVNGIEYLKLMIALQARTRVLASKLRDAVVDSLQVLMARELKGAVLNFEGEYDLLKISMKVMAKQHPPPGVEMEEYARALSSLEKRLSDLQGAADEMHAHLEELQRSRTLQATYEATLDFQKTMVRAKNDMMAFWTHADNLDIGFGIVGTESKDVIPEQVLLGYDTVSPEARGVHDLIGNVRRHLERLQKERASVSGDSVYELNPNIPSDMLSSLQGLETMTEGTLRKAREQLQTFSYMVGPQDVPELVGEYRNQLLTLNSARLGARLLHLEATLYTILGDELKGQVDEAEEAAAFMFPEDSPLVPKMARLKSRFDDAAEHVMSAKVIADAEESLSASRNLLGSMHNLIRESLMRNMQRSK